MSICNIYKEKIPKMGLPIAKNVFYYMVQAYDLFISTVWIRFY